MRRLLIDSLLWLGLAASASAQMNFSLASDRPRYAAGEAVKLFWKLHNGTDRNWVVYEATIGTRKSFPHLTLNIEGPSGRQRVTPVGVERASTLSACRLYPGQTLETAFNLSDWMKYLDYRMPAGQYSISGTFTHRAEEYRGTLVGRAVRRCGSTELESKANAAEIWDGTLSAQPISITLM